jgi:hypothetical protein
MNVYTYSEARQNFSLVLETAKKLGRVFIQRRDGSLFKLEYTAAERNPFLSVKGIKTDITTKEMLSYIREGREEK